jgi:hypothetical protein
MVFRRDQFSMKVYKSLNLLLSEYKQKPYTVSGKRKKMVEERRKHKCDKDEYIKSLHEKGCKDNEIIVKLVAYNKTQRVEQKFKRNPVKDKKKWLLQSNRLLRKKIITIKIRNLEREYDLDNKLDLEKSTSKLEKENRILTEKVALIKDCEEFKVIFKEYEPKREAMK